MHTFTYSYSLILTLPLLFTFSTLAHPLVNKFRPPYCFPAASGQQIHPNINIACLLVTNDLPQDALPLFMLGSFQATEYLIPPGGNYHKFMHFTLEQCTFLYGGSNPGPIKGASINCYDPNGLDKDHNTVYWSVRMDGLYHSWDFFNWEKKADWGPPPSKTLRTVVDEP